MIEDNRSTEYSLSLALGIEKRFKKQVIFKFSKRVLIDPGCTLQLAIHNSSN